MHYAGRELVLFRTEIMELLATDPEVIRIGSELFLYQGAGFCLWAFHFVFMRGLQGAGDMTAPMLISIVGCDSCSINATCSTTKGLYSVKRLKIVLSCILLAPVPCG